MKLLQTHPITKDWGFDYFAEKDPWRFNSERSRRGQYHRPATRGPRTHSSERHELGSEQERPPRQDDRPPRHEQERPWRQEQSRPLEHEQERPRHVNPIFPRSPTQAAASSAWFGAGHGPRTPRGSTQQPVISSRDDDGYLAKVCGLLALALDSTARTVSQTTLGDLLSLQGQEYLLTAAHPFLDERNVRDDLEVQIADERPQDMRVSVSAGPGFSNLAMDWLLVKVPRSSALEVLLRELPTQGGVQDIFSERIPPSCQVMLRCGRSGNQRGRLLGTSFSLGLRWTGRFIKVWPVEASTGKWSYVFKCATTLTQPCREGRLWLLGREHGWLNTIQYGHCAQSG